LKVHGGSALVDGTKIKSNTNGILVLGSYPPDISKLEMKGGWSIETKGVADVNGGSSRHNHRGAHGIKIMSRATARLKDGYIHTTSHEADGILVMGGEAKPLEAESITIVTEGVNSSGVVNYNGDSYLKNVDIHVNSAKGIYADNSHQHNIDDPNVTHGSSSITMDGGSLAVHGISGIAALATSEAKVALDKVAITTLGDYNDGLSAFNNSEISLRNGSIDSQGRSSRGVFLIFNSKGLIDNSYIKLSGEESYGVYIAENSQVDFSNSQIDVSGVGSTGIVMFGRTEPNQVTFDHSGLTTQNGRALVANGGIHDLTFLNGSRVEGDSLVSAGSYFKRQGSIVNLNANDSQLFGRATVDAESKLAMKLENNSSWILRPSAAKETRSDVSFLSLDNSHIIFDQNGQDLTQTLYIGSGTLGGENLVYQAGKNASITFNTLLNEGGDLDQQKTDRLIINGDVSGSTYVIINPIEGILGGITSPDDDYKNVEGISLIQVSGQAQENSFQLQGGYVALNAKPYQYVLNAYGPQSQKGAADKGQKLVAGDNPHWDFRLQSKLTTTNNNDVIWEVAPQVASYLVAPIALFQAQSLDIGTLHQHMGDRRSKQQTNLEANTAMERGAFFLRASGGDFYYQSNLPLARYGYDANIRYQAMQAGGNLYGYDTKNSQIRFGLAGSYGDLVFKPRGVDGAHPTHMDVGRIAPYMAWLHEGGAYINIIASYGRFDGFVSTSGRGHTARLKGQSVAASFETGMPFAFSNNPDVTFEPQAQLIYQKLEFGRESDIDGFAVDLGNPEQWVARAGFKLQKQIIDGKKGKDIKIHGSLHLKHSFADNNKVWLGESFELGRSGTHLELSAGMEAQLSHKISLQGALSWQRSISHGGSTGLSVNTGLRFQF